MSYLSKGWPRFATTDTAGQAQPAGSFSPTATTRLSAVVLSGLFALFEAHRAHRQVCQVYCGGSLAGDCPGGVGCPQTPEECLAGLCLNEIACGCLSLTDCKWDGVSILPTPVCGNGNRDGTEECDPAGGPFDEADCACPGQCQADCRCPVSGGQVCGNNDREGTEQCDGYLFTVFPRDVLTLCLPISIFDGGAVGSQFVVSTLCGPGASHRGA